MYEDYYAKKNALMDILTSSREDKSQLQKAQQLLQNISIDFDDSLPRGLFANAVSNQLDEKEEDTQLGDKFAIFLIEKGFPLDKNQPTNGTITTALHIAASLGNLPITQYIVAKGGNLLAQNDEGQTARDLAQIELDELRNISPDKEEQESLNKEIADFESVVTFLNKKMEAQSMPLIIPSDSPMHAERKPTPPPCSPSPTEHSPSSPGSPVESTKKGPQ